jgi:hypothetical protein
MYKPRAREDVKLTRTPSVRNAAYRNRNGKHKKSIVCAA